ncbi:hypothetical protein WJX74_001455 [Apatococcus lobatus]|uniref:Thioredoxin domain-containing protein n=1 Tax=Apatococcus lobatus TaxID=904363 RepID=A0AAW1S4N0_9CHLO
MASLTAWTVSAPTCRPAAAAKPLALVQGQVARHSCSVRRRSNILLAKSGVHVRRQISLQVSAQDTKTEAAGPVNDTDFKEKVLDSKVPVLIDFWAPWCGPCRMIAPIVDELALEYEGKMTAFKLNTDESPKVATDYGIRSIPTVMIFKDGQKMETVIGAVPKSTLVQTLEKYM